MKRLTAYMHERGEGPTAEQHPRLVGDGYVGLLPPRSAPSPRRRRVERRRKRINLVLRAATELLRGVLSPCEDSAVGAEGGGVEAASAHRHRARALRR